MQLTKSFGLVGTAQSQEIFLEMCPGVFNSCCLKEDQLRIFSNWVHSRERQSIKRHFQDVGNVYYNMMLEYKKISEMARKTIQTLSYKKIANCKVLA